MADSVRLADSLPVGALDTRASGWWAMIFTIFTEASLFAYLLFSYYYLAAQPHAPGTFPQGGPPALMIAAINTAILLSSSAAVGWAQFSIDHNRKYRLVAGLGLGALLGAIFLVVQCFEWADRPFGLSSSPYSSLYFVVTGFHMAHVAVGVVMLLALAWWSKLGYFNKTRFAHIHIGALYWHFVDAVWLAVFFTFYITPLLGLKNVSQALDPTGPAPETRSPRFLWLLFGCCAAPLFWLGQMMLGYGVTAYACYPGDHPLGPSAGGGLALPLLTFDLIALAGCAAGALVSWRIWTQHRAGEGRNHFLALWGVMSSLWFFAAILFNVLVSLTVTPCLS